MLRTNEILNHGGVLYRVLKLNEECLVWIDINSQTAKPTVVFTNEIVDAIESGTLLREEDPFAHLAITAVEEGSVAQIKRDRGYEHIKGLVNDPEHLDKKTRSKKILEICNSSGATKATVYKLLRRYWQRGQIPNALLPDYKNSGGKGKKRTGLSTKLGRPRKYTPGIGAIVDANVERLFRRVIERHILTTKGTSFPYAHRRFVELYVNAYPEIPRYEVPSLEQMRYFFNREYGIHNTLKNRINAIQYNKDVAPLTSTVNTNAIGPASRIEIDATIADIFLVSDHDPNKIIGRPTVYTVKDTFSRLFAGYYIGFQNPSYATAILALASAMLGKVEHCKQFGFEITSEQWPAIGIPGAILADRGELLGHQIETLENGFSVRIENTPSFRADAKGIVERSFRTLQEEFKPFAPGVVDGPISKKRGGNDYRLDAALNVSEFTKIILSSILYYNQFSVVKDYDRSADMPDDLPTIPLHIWNWGINNRTGGIRNVSEEQLKIGLLPRTTATVSNLGICIFGVYYTSAELLKSGWLQRSKEIVRPKGLIAAYDPASTDRIYLFPTKNLSDYWICRLASRSRQYEGKSFWDVWNSKTTQKKTTARFLGLSEEKRIEHENLVTKIIEGANSRLDKHVQKDKARRIKSIRSNKIEARGKEMNVPFLPQKKTGNNQATIIPFKEEQQKEDYKFPQYFDELYNNEDE